MTGLSAALDAADIKSRMAAMRTMSRARDGMVEDLRDQVRAAGFSERLAKTWRGTTYPSSGNSLNPAALVFSKAPGIIDAYARGVTIVAKAGRRLLAIPTEHTPKKRNGRALSPLEVEARFGRRLRFVPAKGGEGTKIAGKATAYLVLDNVVSRKSGTGFRNASARELGAKPGKAKPVQAVVMFDLVASVRVPKKLDLRATLDRAQAKLPQLLEEEASR